MTHKINLSTEQIGFMLQLRSEGKTQLEIAAALSLSQGTVSRHLAKFPDSRTIARARMVASADVMAQKVIHAAKVAAEDGDAGPALEVLDRLDVLVAKRQAPAASTGTKIMVVVGGVPGGPPALSALPDFTDVPSPVSASE